ncbi:type II secretion system minor pseudopilin GspK [Sphingomonas sanxanigenens]|uniref:Type II secretion system protein K n=1 Tax=Sphingomonas sanxanigenens DSM 19645 = NX02 TaxID=1123269 RepID=W0AF25_9SPHN|nr:type II secretion system minor pseudopilin GspK [Sphingomonas sanxanigenens]AHE54275.1 hypothetical protein NX02_12885 [Sphingomonas sanxanigenens DSM 19645 = NX02]
MRARPPVSAGERGAALLTVLLLVAVISVLAAGALEKLRISTRLAANANATDQARAYAYAAETLAQRRIDDIMERDAARTTLEGNWNGRRQRLPIPGGLATATVSDGGNCFNLNSVVSGAQGLEKQASPYGISQFEALMTLLEIPPQEARTIAVSLADWIDTDSMPGSGGAEDNYYAALAEPYLPPNMLIQDPSELRAVAGVTPEVYARLRPWICALPNNEPSPINVNTLSPEQAPLFAMLIPQQLTLERARQMLLERPANGFSSPAAFWKLPALEALVPPMQAAEQIKVRTRYFNLNISVELAGAELSETALIDATRTPSRLVRRQWGDPS